MKYVVEVKGYNDGHPYEESRHSSIKAAHVSLKEHRETYPKVRFRLIHIIEDFA